MDALMVRQGMPCTAIDCACDIEGCDCEGAPNTAEAYVMCPFCGATVAARCTPCGGAIACDELLKAHVRTYHALEPRCRS